jgi:hypothetical protein
MILRQPAQPSLSTHDVSATSAIAKIRTLSNVIVNFPPLAVRLHSILRPVEFNHCVSVTPSLAVDEANGQQEKAETSEEPSDGTNHFDKFSPERAASTLAALILSASR